MIGVIEKLGNTNVVIQFCDVSVIFHIHETQLADIVKFFLLFSMAQFGNILN